MFRREDGHVLRRALDFEVKETEAKEDMKKQVEEEGVNVVFRMEDALY